MKIKKIYCSDSNFIVVRQRKEKNRIFFDTKKIADEVQLYIN